MKTKLLLVTLLITTFGFSQTYDNNTYFISEIVPSPPNSSDTFLNDSDNAMMQVYQSDVDDTIEYFEFRGTPNATIEDDIYFIAIDGDDEAVGDVQDAINLSGLSFGANGILVIVADVTMNSSTGAVDLAGADISGTKFINPYATALAASSANVVTVQLFADTIEWTDERNAANDGSTPIDGVLETLNKFNLDSGLTTPNIGYDGSFNDQSSTYMIVKSTAGNPKNEIVDTDKDGVLDGVATAWTIYDSVAVLDDDDDDEYAYSAMIFMEDPDITLPTPVNLIYDASLSPSIVLLNQYPTYVARQGTSTGFSATVDGVNNDDWYAGRVSSLTYPDWSFSSNSVARNFPDSELSGQRLSDVNGLSIGEANISFSTLSTNEVSSSEFKIYPNPASDFISIESDIKVNTVEIYSVLGNKVLSVDEFVDNKINISGINNGVYLLKIETEKGSTSKKIVVQ